ncbi:MAG: hypothetical protein JST54_01090 [Deltaproteobacteria bacterium]|nr:hypothetical protein [Deltaproteobacteria bacterium]
MAKRAYTVETACPYCGHSPIAAEEERCPKCMRAFKVTSGLLRHNDREQAPVDAEFGTRIGGLDLLTSDAEVHPGTMVAALGALGALALASATGAVPMGPEPAGFAVLGVANLGLALALLVAPGFARPLVIVSAPLQTATWLWLGRHALPSFPIISVAILPLGVLAGVSGATGPRRRSLVLVAVLGLCTFAGTVRVLRRNQPGPHATGPGLALQLPSGFELLQRPEQLLVYLPIQGMDGRLQTFAFADPARAVGGFWSLAARNQITPGKLAEAASELLASEGGEAVLVHDELRGLPGSGQVAYEIALGGGRVASATAVHLPDDRTALLVVAGPAGVLPEVRQALARGASFTVAAADRR